MKHTYREISTTRVKRWKDASGKPCQKTKKFYQTLNPWNTNEDGTIKSAKQIYDEINKEANAWLVE